MCVHTCRRRARQQGAQPQFAKCGDSSGRAKRGRNSSRSRARGARCGATGDMFGFRNTTQVVEYGLVHVPDNVQLRWEQVEPAYDVLGPTTTLVVHALADCRQPRLPASPRSFMLTTQHMGNGSPKISRERWRRFRCGRTPLTSGYRVVLLCAQANSALRKFGLFHLSVLMRVCA